MLTDDQVAHLRERLAAYKAVPWRDTVASNHALIRRNCAAGSMLAEILDELDTLRAILADLPTIHRRECKACDRIGWHLDNRAGYIQCPKCGGMTKKLEPPATPEDKLVKIWRPRGSKKPDKPKPPRCKYKITVKGSGKYTKRTGWKRKPRTRQCKRSAGTDGYCAKHRPKGE